MALIVKGNVTIHDSACVLHEDPVYMGSNIILMSNLRIGAYSYLTERVTIGSVERIGRFCSIAPGVLIGPGSHPKHFFSTSPIFFNGGNFFQQNHLPAVGVDRTPEQMGSPPRIDHDVWIGAHAIIARSVTIGTGAIIGAGAFVRDDVAPYTIVGGTPARVIGRRFDDDICQRLLATQWWNYSPTIFEGINVADVPGHIHILEERIASATPVVYSEAIAS